MLKLEKGDLLVFGLFLLLSLGFFSPFLTGANLLGYRDLSLYFYPLRHLMVELVRGGQLPLWDQYLFLGYPLLATLQVGFFYPLTLILYILPFNLAFNYYTILHYFLAASFMYFLMRHFQASRPAGFLAGLLFAFSGYLLSVANMNTTLTSAVWAPLILLVFAKLLTGLTVRRTIALSGLFVLQFLGGEPTILYLTVLLLALYSLISGREFWRGWLIIGVGLVVASLAAAAQLLPLLEVISLSLRNRASDLTFLTARSFPPRELINFVFPSFFGEQFKDATYVAGLLGDKYQTWLLSPYFGAVALFFSFWAFRKNARRPLFLSLAALLGLLLAFGRFTPVYAWLYAVLPGLGFIRYPVKFLFLPCLVMPLLAGHGFDLFLDWLKSSERNVNKVLGGLGCLILIGALAWFVGTVKLDALFHFCRTFFPTSLHPFFARTLLDIISADLATLRNLSLLAGLFWAAFYLYHRKIVKIEGLVIVLIGLVCLDLAAANRPINTPVEARVFQGEPQLLAGLKSDRTQFRLVSDVRAGELAAFYRTYTDLVSFQKESLAPNWPLLYGWAALSGRESIEPGELTANYLAFGDDFLAGQGALLALANVKYLLTSYPLNQMALVKKDKVNGVDLFLYRNPACCPRAFVTASIVTPELMTGGQCEITSYRSDRIDVRCSSQQESYLFVGDAFYPGWEAKLNGRPVEIIKAARFFRAVKLPAGEHQVEMAYRPRSFWFGLLLSTLTMLGLGLAWHRGNSLPFVL